MANSVTMFVDIKDLDTVAKEVIDGKWGTGDARRIKLTSAGYTYTKVQARVNDAFLKKK